MLIICFKTVKAVSFHEAEYVSGTYINTKKNGITRYQTVRILRDNNNIPVYCIQPFVDFKDNLEYKIYEEDKVGYNKITEEQRRKLALLAHFGYGYKDRTNPKWYAVTQYLIWVTLESPDNVYFTDKLNGNRITLFENEITEILNDVNNYDITPAFAKRYTVEYGGPLTIKDIDESYEVIKSTHPYEIKGNYVVTSNIRSNVTFYTTKKKYYANPVAFFDSEEGQDLIRPGYVYPKTYETHIDVISGRILIELIPDKSVYSVESSLKDTCYKVTGSQGVIDDVGCYTDKRFTYETVSLPYGVYTIEQYSMGKGYKDDDTKVTVDLTNTNNYQKVSVYPKLIKNKIEINKYACKDDICSFENNASFEIKDKNNHLIDTIKTNELGYAYIELGYGTYTINQLEGIDNYTLIETYKEKLKTKKLPT